MILTPRLLSELWAKVREQEIGVWLRVENREDVIYQLSKSRPSDMRDYTITKTDRLDIIFITCPTVTLEDIPVEPDLT